MTSEQFAAFGALVKAREDEKRREDLAFLMKDPRFRFFLVCLRNDCGIDAAVFDEQDPNALRAARRDGERRIGIAMWSMAQDAAPDMVRSAFNEFANLQKQWASAAQQQLATDSAKEQ